MALKIALTRALSQDDITVGPKKKSKPTAVCVLGSVVSTFVFVGALGIVAILALALAINSGWLPMPPDHRHGPLNPIVDAISDVLGYG